MPIEETLQEIVEKLGRSIDKLLAERDDLKDELAGRYAYQSGARGRENGETMGTNPHRNDGGPAGWSLRVSWDNGWVDQDKQMRCERAEAAIRAVPEFQDDVAGSETCVFCDGMSLDEFDAYPRGLRENYPEKRGHKPDCIRGALA
jgi:hypothetical protein